MEASRLFKSFVYHITIVLIIRLQSFSRGQIKISHISIFGKKQILLNKLYKAALRPPPARLTTELTTSRYTNRSKHPCVLDKFILAVITTSHHLW